MLCLCVERLAACGVAGPWGGVMSDPPRPLAPPRARIFGTKGEGPDGEEGNRLPGRRPRALTGPRGRTTGHRSPRASLGQGLRPPPRRAPFTRGSRLPPSGGEGTGSLRCLPADRRPSHPGLLPEGLGLGARRPGHGTSARAGTPFSFPPSPSSTPKPYHFTTHPSPSTLSTHKPYHFTTQHFHNHNT